MCIRDRWIDYFREAVTTDTSVVLGWVPLWIDYFREAVTTVMVAKQPEMGCGLITLGKQ